MLFFYHERIAFYCSICILHNYPQTKICSFKLLIFNYCMLELLQDVAATEVDGT